jgi:hypothetical protein
MHCVMEDRATVLWKLLSKQHHFIGLNAAASIGQAASVPAMTFAVHRVERPDRMAIAELAFQQAVRSVAPGRSMALGSPSELT